MIELLSKPQLIVKALISTVALWFFIILILSGFKYKLSSLVLFIFGVINILWVGRPEFFNNTGTYYENYFAKKEFLIMFDGACALILSMISRYDKLAQRQSLIICFAILCHTMILLDYKLSIALYSQAHPLRIVTGFFYNWYDELIIIMFLSQMWASYEGIFSALRNVQILLSRIYVYSNHHCKSLPRKKEKGIRA